VRAEVKKGGGYGKEKSTRAMSGMVSSLPFSADQRGMGRACCYQQCHI